MTNTRTNIILLSVDALRADHLSCHGYHRETTPVLDEMAESSLWYPNAYSASSHTREAIPSLLTGRYPDEAVNSSYHLDTETIATVLRREGFTTGAFHSNPFVSRAYGFDRDFDVFDDDLHLGSHKLIVLAQRMFDKFRNRHYARATEINKRSLAWLNSLEDGQPFFLWNHYMDVHGPYEPPDAYRTRYHNEPVNDRTAQRLYKRAIKQPESITDTECRTLIDLYDAEIRYTDDRIGEFIDALETRGLLEQSLVVITADHGDAFGEHGYYEHPRYLHEELTRVPIVVSSPDVKPELVETPVGTLDILPTILDSIDIDKTLPGQSLLRIAYERPANRTVFMQARSESPDSHLWRFGAKSGDKLWLVDYDAETEMIQPTEAMGTDTLPSDIRNHIFERVRGGESIPVEDGEMDEEIERRLSALGYK